MSRWTLQGHWVPQEHPRDTSHAFSASCCRLPIRPVRRHASPRTHHVLVSRRRSRAVPPPRPQKVGTGRIGSRQQLAENAWLVSLGCSGGAPRSCRAHLHIIQLGFKGNPYFETLADLWQIWPYSRYRGQIHSCSLGRLQGHLWVILTIGSCFYGSV